MGHMELKPITPVTQEEFAKYENRRPVFTSEGHFLSQFLWTHYYHTRYGTDDLALYLFFHRNGIDGALPPLCREEDIPEVFHRLESRFHDTLGEKNRLYLADARMVEILTEAGCLENYEVTPDRDSFDYIYEAERLRSLSGRALHKKKNLLNGFLREYEGHFSYETLGHQHTEEIRQFHQRWLEERQVYDKYNSIQDEKEGVSRLLDNIDTLSFQMGGVRIDGELKAYTIGHYEPALRCAFIHIEKADINYHGLYNYINQQFLVHEFPEAEFVNREDDLGQENLRHAKLSYRPLRLEEKFTIRER